MTIRYTWGQFIFHKNSLQKRILRNVMLSLSYTKNMCHWICCCEIKIGKEKPVNKFYTRFFSFKKLNKLILSFSLYQVTFLKSAFVKRSMRKQKKMYVADITIYNNALASSSHILYFASQNILEFMFCFDLIPIKLIQDRFTSYLYFPQLLLC